MRLLAVDPGDVHVGLARFSDFVGQPGTVQCDRAWETNPDDAIDLIAADLLNGRIDSLVVEQFNLYPDKAMAQTGSTMPTCELIGCIKWAHRLDCRRRAEATTERPVPVVDLILQPASIQEPTAGMLRHRRIHSVAKRDRAQIRRDGGEGDHALSAELHGWHYLIRRLGAKAPKVTGKRSA